MKTIKNVVLTVAALAMSLCASWAQLVPNAATSVRFPFTDLAPGFSTPSDATFGVSLNLTNYNRNHALTNYHGIYGSGTSGLHVALDLTTNSEFATPGGEGSSLGAGPVLVVTNAALEFGSIQSFTASIWCNPKNAANSGTTETRLFILGATGDKNNVNNCSIFWQSVNQLYGNVGNTPVLGATPTWPTTDSPGTFPTNQWLFQALTWDGTTATLYVGTDGGGPLTVSGTAAHTAVIVMNSLATAELQIGNRQDTGVRSFCGRLDDFRFYGSTALTGAATAAQVEDIFWAGQAPTNLAAIAGNNVANLTWSPLANAASYTISRSQTSGGPYAQLATGLTSPNYSDTTALNNQVYYYVVSALDSTGDQTAGPISYEYQFTVVAPPSQPVVTPTPGSDQVVLNWTAATGSPGPITYNVGRSTIPGAEVAIASGLSATTYTDTTAISQIPYYYVVTAVNAGLATAKTASAEVTATASGPPPAPYNVTAAPDGPGQAFISWTDMGATSYNILRATSQGGTYSPIATGVTTTSYVDTTILSSVEFYYYEVVAVNGLSLSSPPSSPSPAVPAGQGNQLLNPSFEVTAPTITGWTRTTGAGATAGAINVVNQLNALSVPNTYYNAGMCPPDVPAESVSIHSGTNVANIYDYGTAGSVNAWSQEVGCTPGSIMAASAWTYASHEDLSGPCQFYYEVDFLDLGGNLLACYTSFGISNLTCGGPNSFPLDTWMSLAVTNQMLVTGVPATNTGVIIGTTGLSGAMSAPPGTAIANFQARFVDRSGHGGSIYFDDADLDLVAGPIPPTITGITNTVAGAILVTNTSVTVTAVSTTGTITNAFAVAQTYGLTGATNTVTNNLNATTVGLGTATAIITCPLTSNLVYNLKILATDNNGNSATTPSAIFDTMSPLLVIEAEDYNYSSGGFIDTPANGGLALYALVASNGFFATQGVDLSGAWGGSQAANGSYYRNTDLPICGGAAPNNGRAQKYVIAAADGDTTDVPLEVGYNQGQDWLNYSRTFGPGTPGVGVSAPAGTYTVWSRLATVGGGAALNFYQITSDPTQPNQSSNLLGSFSFTDNGWNTYQYVPLLDSYGNLVSLSLSGVQTLRSMVVGNPNIDFYMLMASTPVLTPSLLYAYPDGLHPFEPTNRLTFTVGPANGAPIASSAIHLILNGVDVTSGVTITASGNSWVGNYPIKSNTVYSAVIKATNTALLSSSIPISFDTFSVNNYQWEAVDYDFSTNNGTAWISGLYIDHPVPTCDITAPGRGTYATNSYFGFPGGLTPGNDPTGLGAVAQQNIDLYFPNDGQNAASEFYRADGVGSQPSSDYVRPQFLAEQTALSDANIGPFNLGYYGNGYWLNYTRHYPTNTFNVWGRLAGGAGPFSGTTLSLVTSGVGTANQTTSQLGTFSDPNAVGWQAWHWIPLLDADGNMVVTSLNGLATLRVTSGNNLNTEFFMLVAAPLPVQLTAALVGSQIQIGIPTQTGYTYALMYSGSLTNPSWSQVGSSIPGDGTLHNVLQNLTGLQGYYQVVVQ